MTTKKTHAISQGSQKAQSAPRNTRFFKEPLYTILHATTHERLAVVGAASKVQALERCQQLRREIHLPRAEELDAVFLESGPVTGGGIGGGAGGVAFFSGSYFEFLESFLQRLDDDELGCPACGR